MRDLSWKEKINAETQRRLLERQNAKAKEAHDNAAIRACATIPNPAAIPKAVEVLRAIAKDSTDGLALQAATKALRDMGVEP